MRFSIIIPAYNAEAYLQRCLDSIFSQEFEDYEVVVINDGSTDDTAELLVQYAAGHTNLRVITQSNQGMATARNRGIDKAKGEYILFVDSDDELMPHALSNLAPQINGEDIIGFRFQYLQRRNPNNHSLSTTHYTLHTAYRLGLLQPPSAGDYPGTLRMCLATNL